MYFLFKRAYYLRMANLREIQLAEREILREMLFFLEANDLPYVALGGTLLGAVRHGGFIPWDDDIDLALPREEYERFLRLAPEKFNGITSPFFVENRFLSPDYPYYFSRVVDRKITFTDTSSRVVKIAHPWVDVFPLDGIPDGIKGLFHKIRLLLARLAFQYSEFDILVDIKRKERPFFEKIFILFGQLLPIQKLFSPTRSYERLDRLLKKYPYALSPNAVNFMGAGKFKEMHRKSLYENTAFYEFEGLSVRSVSDAKTWLRKMYGDYLQPPEPNNRNKHHTRYDPS